LLQRLEVGTRLKPLELGAWSLELVRDNWRGGIGKRRNLEVMA
jgi:hypothetical protein